jgi:hypothetical protein
MNEQSLFDRYDASPLLKKIVDEIAMSDSANSPFQVHLKNLNGSSPAFILKHIFTHSQTATFNHVVVLNDAEEAAY